MQVILRNNRQSIYFCRIITNFAHSEKFRLKPVDQKPVELYVPKRFLHAGKTDVPHPPADTAARVRVRHQRRIETHVAVRQAKSADPPRFRKTAEHAKNRSAAQRRMRLTYIFVHFRRRRMIKRTKSRVNRRLLLRIAFGFIHRHAGIPVYSPSGSSAAASSASSKSSY